MQNYGHADLGTEVARVASDDLERLRRGLEQQRVDDGLVLLGNRSHDRR